MILVVVRSAMDFAWKMNRGIGVDVHVHRISHRLGWLPHDTKTPEQTRLALESWIPKWIVHIDILRASLSLVRFSSRDLWNQINHNIVRFGQTQCLPVGPRCSTCLNRSICPASSAKNWNSRFSPALSLVSFAFLVITALLFSTTKDILWPMKNESMKFFQNK